MPNETILHLYSCEQKKRNRRWKIRLIEEMNSEWNDLYYEIV